jgi:hypothetical protein
MSEERRVSENTKLQGIMNALLLPTAGHPAGGTRRVKDSVSGLRQVLPATPVMPSSVTRIALGQPESVAAPARTAGRLVLAPVALSSEETETAVKPAAARSRLFIAPVADDACDVAPGNAVSVPFAFEATDALTDDAVAVRTSKAIEPGEYAAAISGVMAAVLELTIIEPVADRFVTFEDAAGETIRKTSQRGRAGKLPKQGRTTRRAQQSMAMALRDARRLSQRIADARAEDATRKDIDALWAELIQTRRRCYSPSYAKALREALPVVLPMIVPLGISSFQDEPDLAKDSVLPVLIAEAEAVVEAADPEPAEDTMVPTLTKEEAAPVETPRKRLSFLKRLFAA